MIMTMSHAARRSPLALAILGLLDEEPMHTYRMQQLIKARHKDDVVNVRSRASLYQVINRLERAGLVTVHGTRPLRGPARAHSLRTDRGRAGGPLCAGCVRCLRPRPASSPSSQRLSRTSPLLAPDDALRQLQRRAEALTAEVERIEEGISRGEAAALPRLFLLESEHALAVQQAELAWVRSLIDDLGAGRLTWSAESLAPYLGQPKPPGEVTEGRRTMA